MAKGTKQKCDVCGKSFSRLSQHKYLKHEGGSIGKPGKSIGAANTGFSSLKGQLGELQAIHDGGQPKKAQALYDAYIKNRQTPARRQNAWFGSRIIQTQPIIEELE